MRLYLFPEKKQCVPNANNWKRAFSTRWQWFVLGRVRRRRFISWFIKNEHTQQASGSSALCLHKTNKSNCLLYISPYSNIYIWMGRISSSGGMECDAWMVIRFRYSSIVRLYSQINEFDYKRLRKCHKTVCGCELNHIRRTTKGRRPL